MSQFTLIKPNTKIPFIKYHTPFMTIFCALALAGLVIALLPGMIKWGTSFEGGTSITLHFDKPINVEKLRQVYDDDKRFESVSVQSVGSDETKPSFVIRTKTANAMTCEELAKAKELINADVATISGNSLAVDGWPTCQEKDGGINGDFFVSFSVLDGKTAPETPIASEVLAAVFQKIQKQVVVSMDDKGKYLVKPTGIQGDVISLMQTHFASEFNPQTGLDEIVTVGADVGAKFRNDAILSIFLALALMLLYIAVRFDIRYAPSAVVSLFLTTLITLGITILIGIEITLEIVAAFLSLVGYGINDTIVTFDRVRENSGLAEPGVPLSEIVNQSINDCLSRTAITSLTTLFAVVPMAIMATGATKDFSIVMTIGIIVSTFDSIFLSCPFLIYIDKWLKKYQEREAERKALDALKAEPELEN